MIVRQLSEIKGTEREVQAPNGNWTSHRLLLEKDGLVFSLNDTTIFAATRTLIHYKHHIEAVYCIEGEGAVELVDQGTVVPLRAGTMYVLNQHEKHYLVAHTDLRIICVFSPPLTGDEVHRADGSYAPPAAVSGSSPDPGQEGTEKLKFAYLNLHEQPRGNYMLDCLLKAGLEPVAIIEEDSSLARKGRENLTAELRKISPEIALPSLAAIVGARDIPRLTVANHNDRRCEEILRDLRPDLIVLGDTRIIQPRIIDLPPLGIVNVHPGFLPDVRGNNPYIWSIIHDLPQGCTVHFIDREIDTGPIILRRRLRPQPGSTYPLLLDQINRLCGELLVEALHYIRGGMLRGIPQRFFPVETGEPRSFKLAPPEIKAAAIAKLELGGSLSAK